MSRRTALHAVTPNSGTNRHHNRRHNLLHKVCIVGFCLARKLGLTPVNIIQYWNYIETSRSLIGCNGTMPRSRMDELYVLAERTGRIVHIQRSAYARNSGFSASPTGVAPAPGKRLRLTLACRAGSCGSR